MPSGRFVCSKNICKTLNRTHKMTGRNYLCYFTSRRSIKQLKGIIVSSAILEFSINFSVVSFKTILNMKIDNKKLRNVLPVNVLTFYVASEKIQSANGGCCGQTSCKVSHFDNGGSS
ncbi:hypothetical protein CEXT_222181 [Caerostris extrusa]|uniref:Uncharacterized protein n=1 Tax=Caerostris extrusa TaxID=172846 RepID=A0AAV4QM64_CAEEX|nr:hypothetical protein CEXT_222181 [Caerostris extrusa]